MDKCDKWIMDKVMFLTRHICKIGVIVCRVAAFVALPLRTQSHIQPRTRQTGDFLIQNSQDLTNCHDIIITTEIYTISLFHSVC